MTVKNEIRAYIVREGTSMNEVLEKLAFTHGWSRSISNFSGKLTRGTLRYSEAKDLADVLGYEIVWVRKKQTI